MTASHLAVRMMPPVMLLLWAVATWLEPRSTAVAVAFMVLLGVAFAAAALEVRQWRKWKHRRHG